MILSQRQKTRNSGRARREHSTAGTCSCKAMKGVSTSPNSTQSNKSAVFLGKQGGIIQGNWSSTIGPANHFAKASGPMDRLCGASKQSQHQAPVAGAGVAQNQEPQPQPTGHTGDNNAQYDPDQLPTQAVPWTRPNPWPGPPVPRTHLHNPCTCIYRGRMHNILSYELECATSLNTNTDPHAHAAKAICRVLGSSPEGRLSTGSSPEGRSSKGPQPAKCHPLTAMRWSRMSSI